MGVQQLVKPPPVRRAVSAVTDGDPEDINEMPTTKDPDSEGLIYDGSHLHTDEEQDKVKSAILELEHGQGD